MSAEIKRRILASSRCFYGLRPHLRSKLLSKSTKLLLYKTLIRPVLLYGSESWTMTKKDEQDLLVHERRILRCIFGPVLERGEWRRRNNQELYCRTREPDISRVVRLGRLRWAGHLARMENSAIPHKVLTDQIFASRRGVGRPKLRWCDGVAKDARDLLGTRNWRAAPQKVRHAGAA